jgi:hypothetical protein
MDDSERLKTNASVWEAFFHGNRRKVHRDLKSDVIERAIRERLARERRIEELAEEFDAEKQNPDD